jgi:hypothetical protein
LGASWEAAYGGRSRLPLFGWVEAAGIEPAQDFNRLSVELRRPLPDRPV